MKKKLKISKGTLVYEDSYITYSNKSIVACISQRCPYSSIRTWSFYKIPTDEIIEIIKECESHFPL